MKILWLDINSSYSHTSVALPAIHAQLPAERTVAPVVEALPSAQNQGPGSVQELPSEESLEPGSVQEVMSEESLERGPVQDLKSGQWEWCVVRGTINDNPGNIAAEVVEHRPDVIAATFWLFTHRMQIEVLSRVNQMLPETVTVCGGPEFLGDNEDFLHKNSFITAVIRGEGEKSLPLFLDKIADQEQWKSIEGLCWISQKDMSYHDNGTARVQDFSSLKYPEQSRFFNWDKPFVQLETTRGCFNTCAFCVSGGEKPVRYQSLEQVESRLENIHAHGIKDIRVLDRTFNFDTERACRMLDIFARYEGKMRFHLEIHPSLLSETLKSRLKTMPKDLLHLEAGIQSLDEKVLTESGRKGSLESSIKGLEFLCSLSNVQTHADLIAGLPSYSLEQLLKDVARLIGMGVDELQIESLKVLPGTRMRKMAEDKGLKYSPLPPYEILQTPDISPKELREAMQVSRTVDLYYNSSAWQQIFRKLVYKEPDFLRDLTKHLENLMVLESPVSLERRGVILYEYCRKHHPDMVPDINLAWIQGGFSLKKEPAGNTQKIKNIEAFLTEHKSGLRIEYGQPELSHRYHLLIQEGRNVLWGYDSLEHHPAPVFMATLLA